jgi:oligopeptide/dipeptide ABC transporter ATP-binding protein
MAAHLFDIRNLSVSFPTRHGAFKAVDGLDLTLERNEVLAIVGESGSGKSVAMLAATGLLPPAATVAADRMAFDGADLLAMTADERRRLAGKDLAMIFQEPMSSLNPCFTVGFQIGETLKTHLSLNRAERGRRIVELLAEVGIPDPARRARAYPHQLSGGMSQRVMIAMALACRPKLLIADEPTTALDVTIQAQILDLLMRLKRDNGMGLVLITHDMGVVAETADRVIVMYAGHEMEMNGTRALFADPHHPYTAALLAALPERATERRLPAIPGVVPGQFDRPRAVPDTPRLRAANGGRAARSRLVTAILEARDLTRDYSVSRGAFRSRATIKALSGVSFSLQAGRTLAVVGESGSGKSTLARLLTLIENPTAGALLIDGEDVAHASAAKRKRLRREIQIVFQNPYGSLNPRQTIGKALEEPLLVNTRLSAAERKAEALSIMAKVGLRPEYYHRYPHMFSGGQRQRIAIARALMLKPKILVLDEPVSALDVSIRAQALNLLASLQEEFALAYVFVSHDLSVVRHIADEVMVIYLGHAVELGQRDAIFMSPQHPYTRALLSATPVADPAARRERIVLSGEPPSPFAPPPGCPFNPRCPQAFDRCRAEMPPMERKQGRDVACWAVGP